MKNWKCIYCGRLLGERHVIHTCRGTLRKRNRFTTYFGNDEGLKAQNLLDYEDFQEKQRQNKQRRDENRNISNTVPDGVGSTGKCC